MMYKILQFLNRLFPAREVFAHCDIPCGIYTVEPALTAAKTVARMTELIQQLEPPNLVSFNMEEARGKINSMVRYIATKEQHAQKCKEELLILWTDYFKPEHLETFPNLHETFWKAAKLCSRAKQEVSMEAAKDLQKAVEEIAQMFDKSHKH